MRYPLENYIVEHNWDIVWYSEKVDGILDVPLPNGSWQSVHSKWKYPAGWYAKMRTLNLRPLKQFETFETFETFFQCRANKKQISSLGYAKSEILRYSKQISKSKTSSFRYWDTPNWLNSGIQDAKDVPMMGVYPDLPVFGAVQIPSTFEFHGKNSPTASRSWDSYIFIIFA
jgi:hypothetical protein